jgi:DnaK suppressor protein
MDETRARALLTAERTRVQALLDETTSAGQDARLTADEQPADIADPVEAMVDEQGDDAVAAQLRERLVAIDRAERRLTEGTYGRSIRSGAAIPDDRLEADPAAELTAEEAEDV